MASAETDKFLLSAELYDAIYHFKNYQRESERLRDLIVGMTPGARTLLDVACGTGEHAKFLRQYFAVDGVDVNEHYLEAARTKNPSGKFYEADMTDFDLGARYDVVTCLFSAIGYVKTTALAERAIAAMARHVGQRGVLILEPWFPPDHWKPGMITINTGETKDGLVCRMALSRLQDNVSVMSLHYLHGTKRGVHYYTEQLELGLFTKVEITRAFELAGMRVVYEPEGLIGRCLY
ncbi:MAG TPA: class I SAM-dependent methyltransferase, partial [Candidatus Binataceae bacterium]|nr:class I SAM-dependent methyltransferase [Candidatus Binataceae bacterium]